MLAVMAADAGAGSPDAAPAGSPDAAPATTAAAAPTPAPAPKLGLVAKYWQALRVPATGPALSIGTTNNGCLQGAASPGPELFAVRNTPSTSPAVYTGY